MHYVFAFNLHKEHFLLGSLSSFKLIQTSLDVVRKIFGIGAACINALSLFPAESSLTVINACTDARELCKKYST